LTPPPESLSRKSSLNKFNSNPNSRTPHIKKCTMSTLYPFKLFKNSLSWKKFKRITHSNPSITQILTERRVKKAKTFLCKPTHPVKSLLKVRFSAKETLRIKKPNLTSTPKTIHPTIFCPQLKTNQTTARWSFLKRTIPKRLWPNIT
jgi:hypothetical protein